MRANHAIAVQIECSCCSATMQLGVQRQCNSVCRSMRFRSQVPNWREGPRTAAQILRRVLQHHKRRKQHRRPVQFVPLK
jgi:hypothetical protein